jgi:SAM-dependent methyltransferase
MKVRWRRRLWYALIRSRVPFKGPLVRAYLRVLELYRSCETEPEAQLDLNGIPVPPVRLRVLVAGVPDRDWFLRSGQAQTNHLRDLLAGVGSPLEGMRTILDFGCGCGRMARWWSDLSELQLHGCDYNRELVGWCQTNLPFVNSTKTELEPPLPYAEGSFDFLYAFSVFTHMSVELASSWVREFERVVKPGGLLWFTIHGMSYRARLPGDQRRRFDDGEIVVWFPEIEGTNLCAAYWPDVAIERMLGDGFELLTHLDPQADPVRAQVAQLAPHDSYLVRRR